MTPALNDGKLSRLSHVLIMKTLSLVTLVVSLVVLHNLRSDCQHRHSNGEHSCSLDVKCYFGDLWQVETLHMSLN